MLSRPTIDGDTVENVVPLAALDEMTEAFLLLSYWYGFDDRELMDSVLLLDDTGLDNPERS